MHQPLAKKAHIIAGLLFPSLISALGDRLLVLLSGGANQKNIMIETMCGLIYVVKGQEATSERESMQCKLNFGHLLNKLKRTY